MNDFRLHFTHGQRPLKSGLMTDLNWFYNRLTVLLAQDALLTGGVALANCDEFRQDTEWIDHSPDPKWSSIKRGGVHRAQPFSHEFENDVRANRELNREWLERLTVPQAIQADEDLRN